VRVDAVGFRRRLTRLLYRAATRQYLTQRPLRMHTVKLNHMLLPQLPGHSLTRNPSSSTWLSTVLCLEHWPTTMGPHFDQRYKVLTPRSFSLALLPSQRLLPVSFAWTDTQHTSWRKPQRRLIKSMRRNTRRCSPRRRASRTTRRVPSRPKMVSAKGKSTS